MENKKHYGPMLIRFGIGLIFIVTGLLKFINPPAIIGMLDELGFPAATFLGWLLLLSEIVLGIAIFIGYKVKYFIWPLILVLVIAILTVHLPNIKNGIPMAEIMLLFHILGITALLSLFYTGCGAMSVDRK